MRPICVDWPVPVTTNVAVPRVTCVFWNTRFVRSPRATSPPANVARVLGHRRALAGQRRLLNLQRGRRRGSARRPGPDRRPRAARRRPARASVDSISSTCPERRTRACGTCSWASASTLARAFSSWFEPMTTLNVTSASTTRPVAICPIAKLATDDDQQHDVHRVDSWPRATVPHARRRLGGQLVRPVLGQPPLHLRDGQPLVRIDTHLRCHIPRRQRIPGDGAARVLSGSSGHLSSSTTFLGHAHALPEPDPMVAERSGGGVTRPGVIPVSGPQHHSRRRSTARSRASERDATPSFW